MAIAAAWRGSPSATRPGSELAMEFFKIRRTIPFMRHALIFNVVSAITFLAAVFFLAYKGLNFSVEFTGGTPIEAGYQRSAGVGGIRTTPDCAGCKPDVQNSGPSPEVRT